jgi:small subunit ribosomal protein S21
VSGELAGARIQDLRAISRIQRSQLPTATQSSLLTKRKWPLQVLVRDNNVDQALRVLKKKMQREGVFREMKQRRFYEKPSERTTREKAEAIRRSRKLARKQAIREGLIAAPKKTARPASSAARPAHTAGVR